MLESNTKIYTVDIEDMYPIEEMHVGKSKVDGRKDSLGNRKFE